MMGDGVGDQSDPAFSCDLLHNLCLPDTRRPHEKNRPLPERWYQIMPVLVFLQVSLNGIQNLLLCSFDMHPYASSLSVNIASSKMSRMAHAGVRMSLLPSSIKTKAVSYAGICDG